MSMSPLAAISGARFEISDPPPSPPPSRPVDRQRAAALAVAAPGG
jgi:hypothetical protein